MTYASRHLGWAVATAIGLAAGIPLGKLIADALL
jgi:hypothetical protein